MKNYLKEEIKHIPFAIIMFVLLYGITAFASGTLFPSNEVVYDNMKTGINANTVQDAVDQLYASANDYSTYNSRLSGLENEITTYDTKISGLESEISSLSSQIGNIDFSEIEEKLYPIGSLYFSTTDDTVAKVEAKLGGTWEVFGAGRTLVGVGTGIDDNSTQKVFAANETGGEYSHTLTVAEMPSHSHTYNTVFADRLGVPAGSWTAAGVGSRNISSSSSGGNQAHNNIQPYITVYMWKRTA